MSAFDWKGESTSLKFSHPNLVHKGGRMPLKITTKPTAFDSCSVRVHRKDGSQKWYPNVAAAARDLGIPYSTAYRAFVENRGTLDGLFFEKCDSERER